MIKLDLFDPRSLESIKRFNQTAHPFALTPIRSRLFSRLQKAARKKLMGLDVIVQGPLDLILLSDLQNIVAELETGTNHFQPDNKGALSMLIGHIENKCVAFSLIKETLAITEAKYVANVMTEENIRDTQFYQSLQNFSNVVLSNNISEEDDEADITDDWDKMSNARKREVCDAFTRSTEYTALVAANAKTGAWNQGFRNWLTLNGYSYRVGPTWTENFAEKYKDKDSDEEFGSGNFSNAKQIWERVTLGLGLVTLGSTDQTSALSFMANLQALRFKPQREADPKSVADLWTNLVQWSNKGKGLPLEAVQRKKFIKSLFQLHASICSDFNTWERNGNESGQIAAIMLMYWFLYYLELKEDDNVLPRIVRMVASTAWATSLKAWAAKIASWYLHFSKLPMSILYQESELINGEIESFMAKAYLTDQQLTKLNEHKAKLAEDADNVLIPSVRDVIKTEFANYKAAVHADYLLPDSFISYYWPYDVAALPSADSDSLEHLFHHHSASSPVSTVLPTTRPKAYNALCDVIMDSQNAMVMYKNLMDYLLLNYDGFPIVANSIEIPDDGKTFTPIDQPIYWDFMKHNPYTAITKKYDIELNEVKFPSRFPLTTPYDGKYFKPMWQSTYHKPLSGAETAAYPLYYLRGLEVPKIYAQFQEFYSIPVPYPMVASASKEATKATFDRLSEMMMNLSYGWNDEDKFITAAKILCSTNTTKARALADLLAGDMFCYIAKADGKDCVPVGSVSPGSIGALTGIRRSTPGPKVKDMWTKAGRKSVTTVKYWDFLAFMAEDEVAISDLNNLIWHVVTPTVPAIYGHPTREMISLNRPGVVPDIEFLNDRMRLYKVASFEGEEFYVAFIMHNFVPIMQTSEKGIWETVDLGISVDVLDTTFVKRNVSLSAYSEAFTKDLNSFLASAEMASKDCQLWVGLDETVSTGRRESESATLKFKSVGFSDDENLMDWIDGMLKSLNKPLRDDPVWTYLDYFYNTSTVVLPHVRFRPQELSDKISDLWKLQFKRSVLRLGEYDLIETAKTVHDDLIMLDRADYQVVWKSEDHPLLSGQVDIANRSLVISNSRPTTPTSPGNDEHVPANALTPSGGTDSNPQSNLFNSSTAHPEVTEEAAGGDTTPKPEVAVTVQTPATAAVKPNVADPIQPGSVVSNAGGSKTPAPTVGDPGESTPARDSSPMSATIPVEKVDEESEKRAEEANVTRKPNKKRKRGGKPESEEDEQPKDE